MQIIKGTFLFLTFLFLVHTIRSFTIIKNTYFATNTFFKNNFPRAAFNLNLRLLLHLKNIMRTAYSHHTTPGTSTSLPRRRSYGPVKNPCVAARLPMHSWWTKRWTGWEERGKFDFTRKKKNLRNLQKHAGNQKKILRNVDLEICTFHIVIYFARSRRYIFCAYKNFV